MVRTDDPWFPLTLSREFLGPQPVPFHVWLRWHAAHMGTILRSRTATDPFPDGVLT
jgi:hypothetical protein